MHLLQWPSLLKSAAREWSEDKASRHAAALSYYALFSIAPLLIIAIAVAGAVFGEEAARGALTDELGGMLGKDGAQAVQSMIENASKPREGIVSAVLGVAVLLFGASGAFAQLQDSLNTIWEVRPKPGKGVLGFIKARFLSFGMVLVIAFLLLISLALSAALSAVGAWLGGLLPGQAALMRAADLALSLGVVSLLFAAIFRFLPDAKIAWRDVWTGALVTAVLFTIGRYLIGLYIGRGAVGSAFGAAGSLVVVLLWVYYSSQILLFGAEFTQVYAARFGSRVIPDEDAEAVTKPEPVGGKPVLAPKVDGGPGKAVRPSGEAKDEPAPENRPVPSAGQHGHRERAQDGREREAPALEPALAKEADSRAATAGPERPGRKMPARKVGAASMAYSLAVLAAAGAARGVFGRGRRFLRGPRSA